MPLQAGFCPETGPQKFTESFWCPNPAALCPRSSSFQVSFPVWDPSPYNSLPQPVCWPQVLCPSVVSYVAHTSSLALPYCACVWQFSPESPRMLPLCNLFSSRLQRYLLPASRTQMCQANAALLFSEWYIGHLWYGPNVCREKSPSIKCFLWETLFPWLYQNQMLVFFFFLICWEFFPRWLINRTFWEFSSQQVPNTNLHYYSYKIINSFGL